MPLKLAGITILDPQQDCPVTAPAPGRGLSSRPRSRAKKPLPSRGATGHTTHVAADGRRSPPCRPSLAFALQEQFPLTYLTVLWQPAVPGQEAALARLLEDLKGGLAEKKRRLSVQAIPVEFRDPLDLQECFRVLWDVLQSEQFEDAGIWFNLNNGTHTMQMAMFLLAKYWPKEMPINLLQVFPGPVQAGASRESPFGARARQIDLGWENLQPIERRMRKEKEEILQTIAIRDSHHVEVQHLFQEIVDIGCYTDDLMLLTGPTGSGKTRIAQEIHHGWARRRGRYRAPFLELNAAGLSGDLMRSTLFGHAKGAFTGAYESRDGFLLAAHRGTLFLDEIGELDLGTQAELLVAIETKAFFPVGSTRKKTSEFRLICATNRDLYAMVRQGTFREDLLTRIRCWEFRLPGIRELPRDFEDQIDYEIRLNNAEEFRKGNPEPFRVSFHPKAKAAYLAFGASPEARWTGNYRDLKFSVRRLALKARLKESRITPELVAEEVRRLKALWGPPTLAARSSEFEEALRSLEQFVRETYPERNFLDGIEAFLLSSAFARMGNKATVARWLYEEPGKALGNPSNRFRERFQSLFGKIPRPQ